MISLVRGSLSAIAKWNSRFFIVVSLAVSIVTLVLDLMIPLGVAVHVIYPVSILIALRTRWFKYIFFLAVFCSCLIFGLFFIQPEVPHMWKVMVNRLLSVGIVWVTAILGLQRIRSEDNRAKAMEDVRTLRGMLPICSSCKKIRDDKGYWTQIERYIRDHADVEFTHGLCPECVAKLYPEYTKDIGPESSNNSCR